MKRPRRRASTFDIFDVLIWSIADRKLKAFGVDTLRSLGELIRWAYVQGTLEREQYDCLKPLFAAAWRTLSGCEVDGETLSRVFPIELDTLDVPAPWPDPVVVGRIKAKGFQR